LRLPAALEPGRVCDQQVESKVRFAKSEPEFMIDKE
jgi:hypothetical protein